MEVINLTPTIKAVMFTSEDLLSPEELEATLKTIPVETLKYHEILIGDDTPAEATREGEEYADRLLSPTRMKREGYTISDKSDFYWFGHRKWSSRQGAKPDRVVWHHMGGNLTPKQFLAIMQSTRQMSPTTSIHTDKTVYAWVPEEERPWTTGTYACDRSALTFELANDQIGGQWHISDAVIDLAAQIHAEWSKRYGIPTTYSYRGAGINMHKDWANTACPGPYLEGLIKNGTITKKINAYLNPPKPKPEKKTIYRVQCGAFKRKQNAVNQAQKLKNLGYQTLLRNEDGYIKVQVGAYSKKANAEKAVAELKSKGFKPVIVEVKA